ncbi:MAG: hypothetical protein R2838_24330 [Caldilineaceae bacterium]
MAAFMATLAAATLGLALSGLWNMQRYVSLARGFFDRKYGLRGLLLPLLRAAGCGRHLRTLRPPLLAVRRESGSATVSGSSSRLRPRLPPASDETCLRYRTVMSAP